MRRFVSSRGMIPAFMGLIVLHLCTALLAQESVQPTTSMQRAHELMMDNMSYFLDGAVDVDIEAGEVNWNMTSRQVLTQMERIVRDIHGLQSLDYLTSFRDFSSEVEELIERVDGLSHRDLRRWRMAAGLSESQEWYVMVQSALDELKMQIAMELNVHYNAQLKEALDEAIRLQNEVGLEIVESADWDPQSLLPPLDWTASEITQSELSSVDQSEWIASRTNDASGLDDWLQRILNLLESQDQRLRRLEGEVVDPQGSRGQLLSLSTDPSLAHLHMPESLDVGFLVGSSILGLNAKMQLHEIMELMGRYPQIRVVCTGHADATGERNQNLLLSKQRAQRVQAYLLESGVGSDRVLLNYFGEERERRAGSQDRRVEVAFYLR
ncbi:OmpA family protein [Flavobacteriales bacterium]|nr:OmpA family protein [Flavobacteriales bacterium]MDO7741664.1 OmpA family protein [Flavobacteriales bacterium]